MMILRGFWFIWMKNKFKPLRRIKVLSLIKINHSDFYPFLNILNFLLNLNGSKK